MKIGIISDIHDNLWNLSAVLASLRSTELLLCCGDLCSPFVIAQLANFSGHVHIVFGNNDADLYRITANASKYPNIHLYGEWFESTYDGVQIGMNHFDYIARSAAQSGRFDLFCFGHNHEREISRSSGCLLVNPGPVMGAKFTHGWQDVAPTFAIYDTAVQSARLFALNADKRAEPLPSDGPLI